MKPNLPQIKNRSIREQALDTLREAILSGEFKPGHTLTEMDRSRQLGVRRAPIRETLCILNSEGLVKTVPYHGTTVGRLTRGDIEEIYSMRILFETYALDRDFHDTLIDICGNSLLMSMWQTVAMKVRQVMALVNRRNTDLTAIARNHLPLLDAMEAGDMARAKSILHQHNATAGDLIAEDWVES